MRTNSIRPLAALAAGCVVLVSAASAQDARPTLFVVGDSTVKTPTYGQQGWGDPLIAMFDPAKIKVENHAIGGRSSRTFQTEGRWDRILAAAKEGDFVLVQMGHNDGIAPDDPLRPRGTLRGIGEETREITHPRSGQKEIVYTYGWYLRKYVNDAKGKGMTPILVSPIPHCPRQPVEKGQRENNNYVRWTEEVAKAEKVPFIDLNLITMNHYATLTPAAIKEKYFTPGSDNTHTSPAGAERNAQSVVEGIRGLSDSPLAKFLLTDAQAATIGRALPAAPNTATAVAEGAAPKDWIDARTGHRIIRLSDDDGGSSLYFHQNSYTPEGDKLILDTRKGIVAVDLAKLGKEPPQPQLIVPEGRALDFARKTRELYFHRFGDLCAANVDTKEVRVVAKGIRATDVNCDETYIVGTASAEDPTGKTPRPEPRTLLPQRERMFGAKLKQGFALSPAEETSARKEDGLARRLRDPRSQAFVFTSIKTGEANTVGYQYAWLNHLQFSPTDPNLLLYCHEGTWHEVDRIWTIRTDGTQQKLMHKRTIDMEIAGHEFWSHDGRTIWFDLQTPRSQEFWLAGIEVVTGKTTRYKLDRDRWSVHFNVSRDGKLFAGDGGDPGQVAFAVDGQWIYLYRPQADGTLAWERLADLSKHNYRLEPNVTITPDSRWVVFRSNMHGPTHVYAVEITKSP
ncbi:MAG TPA: oligogalacturonate lyase family protein [Pirellulaceae bacterium]|nr:oligogalacturonate lyase family protein [Pirellulaceae bacterium]